MPPRGQHASTCCARAAITRSTSISAEVCAARRRAGLHEHFEPHAETIGVELLVHAGSDRAPQVEVEDTRQLIGRRQRHEEPPNPGVRSSE